MDAVSGPGPRGCGPTADEAVYDQHAARMYRQALLNLGDAGLAEQVVSDVITDECLRLARDPDRAQYRLGVAVRRRCQQLATDSAWWNRLSDPLAGQPGCIAPDGLGVREQAALLLAVLRKLTAADLPA